MADKESEQTPEDTSWVEALSKQKEKEKQVMLEMSNVEEDKGMKSNRCRKMLYVLIVGLVVAVVVLSVKLSDASKTQPLETDDGPTHAAQQDSDKKTDCVCKKKDTNSVCVTEECILAAAQVMQSRDTTADPCESFYDYACGGWMKSHTVPPDRGNLHTYGVIRDDVLLKLKSILEEDIGEDELGVFKKVKWLYQSCVNEELIENRTAAVIYPLVEEFGGWPLLGNNTGGKWKKDDFDLSRLLLSLLKYSNKPMIAAWAGLDDLNNTRYILFIDQPGTWMPSRNYYLDPSLKPKLQAYRTMIRNAAVMLGASETTIDSDLDEIIKLETDLAKIIVPREERRDMDALYNPMTIKTLQNNYTESFKFADQPSCHKKKFDWLAYLQGALEIPDEKVNITEDEELVLVSIPYYKKLWGVLANHSSRTVANYIITTIVLHRLNNLPKRFRNERQMYSKALYGIPSVRDRWKTCAQYVKGVADMVLGRLFVERYFDEKSKTEATDIIKYIREAFYDQLDDNKWMDSDMKDVARKKAEQIVAAVGYPESIMNDTQLEDDHDVVDTDSAKYFENVLAVLQARSKYYFSFLRRTNDVSSSSTRLRWTTSPTTVNAFYSPQRNQISFPAGILQPPYFQYGRPRSMNYGAIGFLGGHEITHGFDDQGRQYDAIGNLKNWWTKTAEVGFHLKKGCIQKQYGQFLWGTAGLHVNGINTLGENIADNGGIKQAYAGYKDWLKAHSEPDLVLPGIDLTNDQLFFVGFAQSRCGVNRKDDAIDHILTGAHSPNKFRVDGSLQNMPEFASVFKCPVNSTMNPVHKCAVW